MNRISLYLLFLFSFIASNAHAQSYEWVRGGGTNQNLASAPRNEAVYSMCSDYNGNTYALSVVGSTAIIADTFYRSSAYGSSQNLLFTSHDCNGQMRFAKLISGSQTIPYGVACDGTGKVYIAFYCFHGNTSGTYLRIGYDTTIIGSIYNSQTLVQFDTAGHMNWVNFVGADEYATHVGALGYGSFLAVDGSDDVHFINSMKYGVSLFPGITSHWATYDLKYDLSGTLLSVKKLDIDSTLRVNGVSLDKESNKLYIYGVRNAMYVPDSSRYDYIAALDVNRDRIWIDTLTNPVIPIGKGFGSIITDGLGNIYATVVSSGPLVYRSDTAKNVLSTLPYNISVVMKMDTAGSMKWMQTYSGSSSINNQVGLTLWGANKLAVCGGTAGMVVSGTDTISVYPGEGQNAYFSILDTAGYVHELNQIHGSGFYDFGNTIVSGKAGNLFIGGRLENNIWGGSLTPYASVGGDSDYFIMKYGVDCGCTAMPVANYIYSGTDLTRSFTYTGTASIDSVRWTFGDGNTSTSMSPVHTYTGSGTFTTCVRVYSPCGNDMRCHEIEVSCTSAPSAAYADTGNYVHGFIYTGTTTAFYDSVRWDFNDGTFDTGLNVIHTYVVADTYHVCAKVYTRCGTDTFCTDVIVLDTSTTVSAPQLVDYEVKVFPNPTTHELSVSGMPTSSHYRILSAIGVTLQSGTLSRGTNTLPTATLPPAMYILEITGTNGSRKLLKFTKQ